jgi:hypothetical protein
VTVIDDLEGPLRPRTDPLDETLVGSPTQHSNGERGGLPVI